MNNTKNMSMEDVKNIRTIGIQIKKNGEKIEKTATEFENKFGRDDGPNRNDFIDEINKIVTDLNSDIGTLQTYLKSV